MRNFRSHSRKMMNCVSRKKSLVWLGWAVTITMSCLIFPELTYVLQLAIFVPNAQETLWSNLVKLDILVWDSPQVNLAITHWDTPLRNSSFPSDFPNKLCCVHAHIVFRSTWGKIGWNWTYWSEIHLKWIWPYHTEIHPQLPFIFPLQIYLV